MCRGVPQPQKEDKSTATEGTDFEHIRNRTQKSRIVLTDRSFSLLLPSTVSGTAVDSEVEKKCFLHNLQQNECRRKRNAMNRYDFGVFTVRRRPYCCGCAHLERACECARLSLDDSALDGSWARRVKGDFILILSQFVSLVAGKLGMANFGAE